MARGRSNASTISGNTAGGMGGGIFNAGTLTLANSTISGNSTNRVGGGIYKVESASTILIFCTLYDNSAAKGGSSLGSNTGDLAATSQGPLVMRNSLVAGKHGDPGPDIVGTIITGGYNLLQTVDPATTTFRDPDHQHATDMINLDLSSFLDATLRSNPGPDGKPAFTQTLALLKGASNPAIDAIPEAECVITISVTDTDGKPVTDPVTKQPITITTDHDQRGVTRPQGNACDIGAYEWVPTG